MPTAVADEVERALNVLLDVVYEPDMATEEVTSMIGELHSEDDDEAEPCVRCH